MENVYAYVRVSSIDQNEDRQMIAMLIALVVAAVVCIIPVLGWIVYGLVVIAVCVAYITFFVLKIVCFFQICSGKAKEPVIIRSLSFLR